MSVKVIKSDVRKFLFELLENHKRSLIIILAIATLGSVFGVFVPFIYGKLFDAALVPNSTDTLLLSLVGVWALLGLVSNYTGVKTNALGEILGTKIRLEMEAKVYGHFIKLPVSFHKNKKIGSVLQKIAEGSGHLQGFVVLVSHLLPQILFMILATALVLIVRWELGMIMFFTFIVYVVVTLRLTKPAVRSQVTQNKIFEREYGRVYDKLYNVFLIKNFALEETQKKQIIRSLVSRTIPSLKNTIQKFAVLNNAQGVIYNLGFVFTLATSILFLRSGQISQGEFIMFFGYINLAFGPFAYLSNFYRAYKRLSVAIKRINNLKHLIPEEMKHGNKVIEEFKGRIRFDGVSFGYTKNKEILKGINLRVKAGESVALVGESGMGKSTLSELILGYYKPSKGKIYLDDVGLSKLKLQWLRDQIAIVPQETSVFNDTLLNNIRYAKPNASFHDVVEAAKMANAHDFIMSLPRNYRTIVGEKGVKLSGGQKQRIAITMAFLKNPKILILDESTAALDAKSERSVQKGIEHLMEGRTTIIIAHRFSTVRNVDRIFVLGDGKVIESGNHEKLMEKGGKYYELYRLQRGLD